MSSTSILRFILAVFAATAVAFPSLAADKKVLLIAGLPSHGPGHHEHNAGVLLLQKMLTGVSGLQTEVALNGWPKDPRSFEGVSAILIYSDGGLRHPVLQEDRLEQLKRVITKDVGLALIHYAVEPTRERGQAEFLQWVGAAFETHLSVNPHWDANFKTLPTHPVTRGVNPLTVRDEWYFNLRFVDGKKGLTPLFAAVPDASTTTRPDGAHSGNPVMRAAVERGDLQTVAWAYERPNGGRGFGFTGGHYHTNWAQPDFRKLVLNAILWIAKMEVPAGGVKSTVTPEDLTVNLDQKPLPKRAAPKAAATTGK